MKKLQRSSLIVPERESPARSKSDRNVFLVTINDVFINVTPIINPWNSPLKSTGWWNYIASDFPILRSWCVSYYFTFSFKIILNIILKLSWKLSSSIIKLSQFRMSRKWGKSFNSTRLDCNDFISVKSGRFYIFYLPYQVVVFFL